MIALWLGWLGCAPMVDVDQRERTYCADLCFEDPAWIDGEQTDPWDCTLTCEEDTSISQGMLTCLGNEGLDPEGKAACEALLGESLP